MPSQPPPPPNLPPPGTREAKLVSSTPVVDIHGHSFNSRFLPIQGIALGKRDIHPVASLMGDQLVIAITMWITAITAHVEGGGTFDSDCYNPNKRLVQDCVTAAKAAHSTGTVTAEELVANPLVSGICKVLDKNHPDPTLRPRELWLVKRLENLFHRHHGLAPAWFAALKPKLPASSRQFLETLTAREVKQIERFHSAFEGQVDLVASMMMDMAPSYNQLEDDQRLMSFESSQISAMEAQQRNASGGMIYFVAYNPFRDHWPAPGKDGKALDIVKHACTHQGAWGVKVYPPSGYAPFKTHIPCPPSP